MTATQVLDTVDELIGGSIELQLDIRNLKIEPANELAANGLKGAMIAVHEAEKSLVHAKRCLNFMRRNS